MNQTTLFITIVVGLIGAGLFVSGFFIPAMVVFVIAVLIFFGLKMADQWERFVILRAGKLSAVKGPGLFFIIPIFNSIAVVINERIQTTAFSAASRR